EVTVKAVPVVEPQRLPSLAGLVATQLYVLEIALPPQRPDQCLPEGGLQEILCLHLHREILNALFGIPALNGFVNGFLDRHSRSPAPSPRLITLARRSTPPLYRGHAMLMPALPYGHDTSGVKTFMPCRIHRSINDWNFIAVSSSGSVQCKIMSLVNDCTVII